MSSSESSEGSQSTDGRLTHSMLRSCAPSFVITEELMCGFCEEKLKTGRVGQKLISCGHIFHPGCILRCLARHRRCPTCGIHLTATAPQYRSDDPNIAEASRNVVNPEGADEEPEDDDDDEAPRGSISILLRRLANTEISEVMLCVICLKNLKPGDVGKKLTCGHIFHARCIVIHYKKSQEHRCPLCRHEI